MTDDSALDNTHKVGSVRFHTSELTTLFGEPQQVNGDYNNQWIIKFIYRSNDDTYNPEDGDEDVDTAIVSIYDAGYPAGTDISTIDNWTVGGHNMVGLWVLEQYLEHNI